MTAALDPTAVWNRAADGEAPDMRPGDVALARILSFHGIAEGDGCLTAVEELAGTETGVLDTMAAFEYYAMPDASKAVDDTFLEWLRALKTDRDEAVEAVELAADERYAGLDVEARLSAALEQKLADSPEDFRPLA
jgi:hypothetical protein